MLEIRVTTTDLLGRIITVAVVRNSLADLPVGELEAYFHLPYQRERGVGASLDRQLRADDCDSWDVEGGAREGDVHDDILLVIRKLGNGFEGKNARDLALVVEGQVALRKVEGQGQLCNDQSEPEAGLNIYFRERLRDDVTLVTDTVAVPLPGLVTEFGSQGVLIVVSELTFYFRAEKSGKPVEDV